jgi:hypothetical protein
MHDKSLINFMILESKQYSDLESIMSLAQTKQGIQNIPVQPLFKAVSNASTEELVEFIPLLSPKQRQVMIDLSFWIKDEISTNNFNDWLEIYFKIGKENMSYEFINLPSFELFLKSRFNISNIDPENPTYPDHEHFIVTDDGLLVFEYDESFKMVDELKGLIRTTYSILGVENAYAKFFKIISDSYTKLNEEEYQKKKSRLDDFGIVDYFDAVNVKSTFNTEKKIISFIENKLKLTSEIDVISKSQVLFNQSIAQFEFGLDAIENDLKRLECKKRSDFLRFNFVRLVNSTISSMGPNIYQDNSALTSISKQTKQYLMLGFSFLNEYLKSSKRKVENIFIVYDFIDLYQIGHSLLSVEQLKINRTLMKTHFTKNDEQSFMGNFLLDILENIYSDVVKYKDLLTNKVLKVECVETYNQFKLNCSLIKKSLPIIDDMFKTFNKLVENDTLKDFYYVNYDLASIDFEALLLSYLVQYTANDKIVKEKKLGVEHEELLSFAKIFFVNDGESLKKLTDNTLKSKLNLFIKSFNFTQIDNFDLYLYLIIQDNMEGYLYSELSSEDLKHVGGPIILN